MIDRLKALWKEEKRLNRAWELAAWKDNWTEAAGIRAGIHDYRLGATAACQAP